MCLEREERLVLTQSAAQIAIEQDLSHVSVHAEERTQAAPGLQRHERRPLGRRAVVAEDGGEALDGRRLEQRGHGEPEPEEVFDFREQTHRQKRMPAEIEEVVLRADGARPEKTLPEERQPDLEPVRGRARQAPALRPRLRGIGKGQPIDFPAGRQRQGREADEGPGHHGIGERLAQVLPQDLRRRRRIGIGDPVGHEALLTGGIIADRHCGLPDAGMPRQRLLDLRRLDPESSDLQLGVSSPRELDATVREQPSHVPGPVDPFVTSFRIGQEDLPCQDQFPPVAEGHVTAADGDLPVHLAGLAPPTEQQDLGVHDGASDRYRGPFESGLLVDEVLQGHGRFRRSETVHEPTAGPCEPPVRLDVLAADLFPSEDDEPQTIEQLVTGQRSDPVSEHRGCRVIDGDSVAPQPVAQARETDVTNVDGTERRGVQERAEDVHHRRVDAVGRQERQPIVRAETETRAVGLDEMQHVPVALQDPFRPTRGPGGI